MKTDSMPEVSFSHYGGKPPARTTNGILSRPLALPGLLPFSRCPG